MRSSIVHDFRRTAARNLINAGVDPLTTMQLVGWENIEIEKAEKRSYSLTLWYRESAMPARAEPEADSKAVARAVLGALVGAGREPAKESIFVSVSAMRHMRGETGAALVNWYGITSYNYNRDALEYKECSSKSWFGC